MKFFTKFGEKDTALQVEASCARGAIAKVSYKFGGSAANCLPL